MEIKQGRVEEGRWALKYTQTDSVERSNRLMLRAGVEGEIYLNYTARVEGPPTQVPAEDEGSPAPWCHCCAPPLYQNSHQEHKPDQWTHTDLKYSEERRQQTLEWGRRLIDGEYQRFTRSSVPWHRAAFSSGFTMK